MFIVLQEILWSDARVLCCKAVSSRLLVASTGQFMKHGDIMIFLAL